MAKAKEVDLMKEKPVIAQKLGDWLKAEKELAAIKATEFALRQEIVNNAGFDQNKLEGSQTINIGFGCKLKAVKVQNYSLINTQGQVPNLLAKIAEKRHDIAVGLVEWKPEMSTKTYKELLEWLETLEGNDAEYANEVAGMLAAAVTIKPGAAQLEYFDPPVEPVIENKV